MREPLWSRERYDTRSPQLQVSECAHFRTQKGLDTETSIAADGVTRVRSRIVQSPERKRRNISTMRDSASEDKRTHIALLERQRELRVKVAALKNIAKVLQRVSPPFFP